MKEPQIYCPHCAWRPTAHSQWVCATRLGGCGTIWNTFLTGGVCPDCGSRWEETKCLSCECFSPHSDWYHWPDDELNRADPPGARHA